MEQGDVEIPTGTNVEFIPFDYEGMVSLILSFFFLEKLKIQLRPSNNGNFPSVAKALRILIQIKMSL